MARRTLASLLAAALAVLSAAVPLHRSLRAEPQPSIVPISWELTFRHQSFDRLIMNIDGKQRSFWYMRYTVVNNSGRDVLFTPSFEIVAETGTVCDAFKDVPNEVFTRIKEASGNPLLLSPTLIYGKLLQGEDNAKDGVMIFSELDPEARNFRLYVSGLSGETVQVENPVTHAPAEHPLHKTLEMSYNIPGEAIGIPPHAQLRSTRWVMK